MKTLHCSDAGFDCQGVIRANSEEEILAQAAQHAREAHNVMGTPETCWAAKNADQSTDVF